MRNAKIVFLMLFVQIIICINVLSTNLYANDSINTKLFKIYFDAILDKQSLKLDTLYFLNSNDSIKFQSLKFYISQIALYDQENKIIQTNFTTKDNYFLVDFENDKSKTIEVNIESESTNNNSNIARIDFLFGIDSLTNVSGPMSGDLDPIKAMYWTWQSGYINFKLDATSNIAQNRKNEIVLHLGGYQYPYLSASKCSIILVKKNETINENNNEIKIVFEMENLLNTIKESKICQIMSPNENSVRYAHLIAKLFRLK